MKLLVLGGAGLTGPHQIRRALSRGHEVTVFNRGRTPLPADLAGVEQLHGDRATGDLAALRGRRWDACIDIPTTLPAWARDAAQVLCGNVERYVFVSTISVYRDLAQPVREGSAVHAYQGADAFAETIETVRASGFELYGPLKARCEAVVREHFPDSAAIVRPGLIVGPGDTTDRFTYWPLRVRRGGELLAPGSPADPVQFIDARDLAEWVVRLAEQGATGTYNATGPAVPLTFGAMLQAIGETLGVAPSFRWAPSGFLQAQGIAPWTDMPAWVPAESAGMMRADNSRALGAGLTFCPLAQTVRDTLAWFDALAAERRAAPRAGLSPERERHALAALK
jgi:2'-hydroxyisoflavone reductase